jgi:hypothetical protein
VIHVPTLLPTPPTEMVSLPAVPRHTTAEAVAALDARFPWLRGAEKREPTRRRPAQATGDDRRVAYVSRNHTAV